MEEEYLSVARLSKKRNQYTVWLLLRHAVMPVPIDASVMLQERTLTRFAFATHGDGREEGHGRTAVDGEKRNALHVGDNVAP